MIQRTRILPVEPIARRLAAKPAAARASRSAAIAAIEADGEYLPEDVAGAIDHALVRAAGLVVGAALEAASDKPWALRLGHIRDALATSVLVALIVYAWAILS